MTKIGETLRFDLGSMLIEVRAALQMCDEIREGECVSPSLGRIEERLVSLLAGRVPAGYRA
jgi:hypothetical protein